MSNNNKPQRIHPYNLMPVAEAAMVAGCSRFEERKHFANVRDALQARIDAMPRTHQTEKDTDPFAHLHYFGGGIGNWYITELAISHDQSRAFGLADPYGDGGWLGYISIIDLCACGIELDLYWTPKRLSEILKETQS